ncbi:FAD-dependent urate hydroxylase [Marinomonas spartinae]|uniref:flavin-dependent oxidoreductase n=1 Tax=Marinomonas spartinae TaxID=1792290 RepID=UPI000808BD22|nr:flavin-dependent oxidoreductase [Marinomonas spartinae]SBS38667.1 FAD-dependent urate hydroxylase [Marinomonas spartinae]
MMSDNPNQNSLPVIIAGGGIGGLTLALTLEQIGIHCVIYESVSELKPLGVGINIQPNAVRELYDLGLDATQLDKIGLQTKEWALVGLNGKEVYCEPRGTDAGYHWPQYSVHRGKLQMLLYHTVLERLGEEAIQTGHKVTGYQNTDQGVTVHITNKEGEPLEVQGALLVAADGLHSAVRAQMHPSQPPIHWGGAVMWRGTTQAKPIRTGASFIGLGTHHHRIVFYPITPADPVTGLATINWIAEVTMDNSQGWTSGDWNKQVDLEDFIHHFENWDYDWVDIQGLLRGATEVFEYPMIDRDPIPTWVDNNVALMGDAAHIMYPTGSNGASQAIVDARILGAALLEYGINNSALSAFNKQLCEPISNVVLRNRGAGPFVILNELDKRCGGIFEDIEDVFPEADRQELMANYKAAAGYAVDALNSAPPTIKTSKQVA